MKRALYNQPDATPCGSTDNRKRNKTANLLHPFKNGAGKLLLTLCLLMASVSAWAQWTDSHGVTFTATSGSNGGNNAGEAYDKACDGRTDTKFCDNFVNGSCWVIVRASQPVKLTGYSLYTANDTYGNPGRNPRTWTIEGSNDGTNWTTFVTENYNATMGATNYTEYFFTCSAPDYYQYFRLTITRLQSGNLFQYSEFHPFGLVEGMESSSRDGYVMFSGSNYLDNSTAGTTTFTPSSCIWRGTSGGPFTNGTNYIRNGQNNIIGTGSDRNCTLGGTESGTTGQTLYTNSRYLRFNNSWTRTSSATDDGLNVVFAVTKDVYSEISTAPTISGADVFDAIGNKTYSKTNASFTQGYIDYIFYNNTHHYFKTDNSTSLNAKPTAESFTYMWSLSDNAADHVSVGESSGVVSYDEYYADDTDVTLTLTATSDNKTFTVNKTIQFLAPREDPTGVSASDMTLNEGEDRTITPTLTPNPCYTRLEFSSANTDIATVNATTGEVTGVAGGQTTVTIKAYKYSAPTQFVSTTITITVMEKVATPVIEFTPQGEGETASTTITCGTAGARIYYTTDGTTPTASSTLYDGAFNVNNLDVVKAIAVKDGGYFTDSEVASATYSKHKMPTPTITIDGSGVSFTCPEGGASFYYTIDGSDPTTSSTEWNGTPFTPSANECTIKVIAVKAGSQNSDVASRPYVRASGISGSTVYINDYEDHNWTYYAGVNPEVDGGHYNTSYIASGTGTRRDVRLYSPKPRNVKITYKANGGAVSIDESATEFVYYKTLEQGATENEYPYQVISNPFSKRPTGKGFGGWKITKGANYIKNKAANATLGLDEEIVFENLGNPGVNITAAEIEFTATWVDATITHIRTNTATTIPTGGNYETKLVVVHAAQTRTLTINGPCTIMMVEPDGSADYRNNTMTSAIAPVAGAANTVKIEFANWSPGDAIDANGRNLTIGRGMKMDGTRRAVYGINANTGMNQTLKIESGNFSTFRNYQAAPGTITKHWVILGNDYDRANGDNDKLSFSGMFRLADGINLGASSTTEVAHVISKSGKFMTGVAINTAAADNSYYIGVASTHNSCYRYLEIQGGEWVNIAGGMGNAHPAADPAFTFRMRGGLVAGSIYGAGAFAPAGGIRTYIITGGEIGGWIAAGCNGIGGSTTTTNNGTTNGNSFVYIGGNVRVGYQGRTVNEVQGGNIFGAGRGASGKNYDVGTINNSNVVVADNCQIEHNVYGGGNYGLSKGEANIYITGGTVDGNVFGGSNMKEGYTPTIYMTGGLVKTGVYGGCNTEGTINNSVTMQINGGQVGVDATHTGNIHGGGYGSATRVSKNVDITLGKTGAAPNAAGVTVYGDVYGGSALGKVNGTSATNDYHTNVTMNAGTINGSLYGGGLGDNSYAANVYGPVSVTVNGGVLRSTDQGGLGAVFGCNNMNGRPQGKVTVDVTGGEMEYIYGGGNAAPYTVPTPNSFDVFHVHMSGGLVHKHVFGGGLGANAVLTGNTEVKVTGGSVVEGNVYGGGHGAEVTGDTHVVIGQ